MTNNFLLYIGSVLIFLWGVAHIIPTKSVVQNFGEISRDNKRIITMEWIAEGLMLVFIGMLVFFVTVLGENKSVTAIFVFLVSAVTLFILALVSFFTGARTSITPMKLCPYIKILCGVLILIGSLQ